MERQKILEIIKAGLEEAVKIDRIELPANIDENTQLFGKLGCLDSLGLISFISAVETEFSRKGIDVTLASENVLRGKENPFLTVGSLMVFIESLINGK